VIRILQFIVSLCIVCTGIAVLISDASIARMCRRECWLNAVFYLIGGEVVGKFLLGGSIIILGVWMCGLAR
jgi:hypothetical protein